MDVAVHLVHVDTTVTIEVTGAAHQTVHQVLGEEAGAVSAVGVVGQLTGAAAGEHEAAGAGQVGGVDAALEGAAVAAVEHDDRRPGR